MASSRFVRVRRHKRSIGRACMHCGRPAVVTATRKTGTIRMSVRYCKDHADQIIGDRT